MIRNFLFAYNIIFLRFAFSSYITYPVTKPKYFWMISKVCLAYIFLFLSSVKIIYNIFYFKVLFPLGRSVRWRPFHPGSHRQILTGVAVHKRGDAAGRGRCLHYGGGPHSGHVDRLRADGADGRRHYHPVRNR